MSGTFEHTTGDESDTEISVNATDDGLVRLAITFDDEVVEVDLDSAETLALAKHLLDEATVLVDRLRHAVERANE